MGSRDIIIDKVAAKAANRVVQATALHRCQLRTDAPYTPGSVTTCQPALRSAEDTLAHHFAFQCIVHWPTYAAV